MFDEACMEKGPVGILLLCPDLAYDLRGSGPHSSVGIHKEDGDWEFGQNSPQTFPPCDPHAMVVTGVRRVGGHQLALHPFGTNVQYKKPRIRVQHGDFFFL